MGWFTTDVHTMDDLFLHSLQDIYYAENRIEKSLPDMIAKASDRELKKGFQTHLKQTRGHIKRLEQAFKKLKQDPQGVQCRAIEGILEEANDIASDVDDKMVLNAALIGAAQAVEHYEITRYGTLVTWAKTLGRNDVAKLLAANLKEEKATDQKLTGIAKKKINRKAAMKAKSARKMSRKEEDRMMQAVAGIPSI